jgi:hypothetical protein
MVMKKKFTKMLTSSALVAAIVVPSFTPAAFAADSNWNDVIQNLPNSSTSVSVQDSVYSPNLNGVPKVTSIGDWGKQINTPLVQSITPAIGSAVVRPDQSVEVQLDTQNFSYKLISKFADRFLSGYILDGKTVIPVDKSQIKFDSVTGKVTVQHPLLNHYTKYAVVLGVSADGINHPFWQDSKDSIDVITAVDTAASTVTTLNHGTVSIDNGRLGNILLGMKIGNSYDVGDVVSVITNKYGGKTTIIPRKDMGASTIFTTGSGIGEAAHLTAAVESQKVRVTDVGKINVKITDDYDQPATNAEVTVTSSSADASTSVLTLGADSNGQGVISVNDLKRESVSLTITSHDKVFTGQQSEQTAQANMQFIAGLPDHMTIQAAPDMVVGTSEHVTGTVFDKYENTVEDDTLVSATTTAGTVDMQQNSKDGTFDFTFTAPTKVQDVTITAKAGDSVNGSAVVKLKADKPANVKATADVNVIKADGTSNANVSLAVTDQYGNHISGNTVTIVNTGKAVVPDSVITDENGLANFTVTSTVSGANDITVTTDNGVKSAVISVVAATPITTENKVSLSVEKKADGSSIITGTVADSKGTPSPYAYVPLEVTGGTLSESKVVTNQTGSFTSTLTPSSPTTGATVSVPTAGNSPEVGIDPLIFGNQPWTDTGIDIVAGQTVRVVSTGPWVAELYAQFNGISVKVGADGTFVAGSNARLFLGNNGVPQTGDVDSIIYLSGGGNTTVYADVLPTLNLVTDKVNIAADGKETATINGRVMAGLNPIVGATVTLSLSTPNGTIPASVVTDGTGNYTTTYTAGKTAGVVEVIANYANLTQKVSVTLKSANVLTGKIQLTIPTNMRVFQSGKVTGKLTDASGNPVTDGTKVTITFPTPRVPDETQYVFNITPTIGGTFTFDLVAPKRVTGVQWGIASYSFTATASDSGYSQVFSYTVPNANFYPYSAVVPALTNGTFVSETNNVFGGSDVFKFSTIKLTGFRVNKPLDKYGNLIEGPNITLYGALVGTLNRSADGTYYTGNVTRGNGIYAEAMMNGFVFTLLTPSGHAIKITD